MQIDDSWYRRPPGIGTHDSAGGVIVRPEGETVLVALMREGGRESYSLPKGHVEPGERLEDAARREIEEEAGLRGLVLIGPLGVRERLDFERTSWKRTHYFLFLAGAPAPETEAAARAGVATGTTWPHRAAPTWFPLDALPAMFWPEQRELLLTERERIHASVARHLVQRQFNRQAANYARSESHARDRDLDLLIDHLHLRPTDRVLDVATGTGFTAFALARAAGWVAGLDLTLGMLRAAQRLSPASGVRWVAADAGALPFADATFDAVTVRRAPHHFPDLERALREMLRVLGAGGRIGVVDQVPPEDEAGHVLMERLEKLRDPSHVEAYTAGRWLALLERLGVRVTFAEVVEHPVTFETWLELAGADPARRRAVEDTLAQATRAARAEVGDDGREPLSFMKRWVVLVGTKG